MLKPRVRKSPPGVTGRRRPGAVTCDRGSRGTGVFPFGGAAALAVSLLALPGGTSPAPFLPRFTLGVEVEPALGAALLIVSMLLVASGALADRLGRVAALALFFNACSAGLWLLRLLR